MATHMAKCFPAWLSFFLLALAASAPDSAFAQQPAAQKPAGAPPEPSPAAASQDIAVLQNQSRSHLRLDRPSNPVEVYLYAPDEKVDVLPSAFCGGDEGAKQFSGAYRLVSVAGNAVVSSLALDPDTNFVEKKPHDGARLYPDPKTGQQLVALFQYGTCTSETVQFFSADPTGLLYSIPFLDKDGRSWKQKLTGPTGQIPRLPDGSSAFCANAPDTGYNFCEAYAFDGANFEETAKWLTSEQAYPEKGLDARGQAMRSLYDFLAELSEKKFPAAAYHYVGYSPSTGTAQAAARSVEKAKMLEAYCATEGGQCLMPSKIEGDGHLDAQGAMPFTVSLQTSDFEPLKINGRSSFDFRMWKTAEGFKVLDLPPRLP